MKVPFYGIKFDNSQQIFLSEIESRHCIKVLRYKIGDEVEVLDGHGNLYRCIVFQDDFRECILDVKKVDFKPPNNHSLHIAVSPPKNPDRIDWLVEKSVELGASDISFVKSDRSIRTSIKIERLERISIAAMKQSYGRYKLRINKMVPLSDVLPQINTRQRLIPHLEEGKRILIQNELKPEMDTCILIGPEGDFTLNEINLAIKNNFKPISLGNQRLRTETAAIMVVGAFNYINEY